MEDQREASERTIADHRRPHGDATERDVGRATKDTPRGFTIFAPTPLLSAAISVGSCGAVASDMTKDSPRVETGLEATRRARFVSKQDRDA